MMAAVTEARLSWLYSVHILHTYIYTYILCRNWSFYHISSCFHQHCTAMLKSVVSIHTSVEVHIDLLPLGVWGAQKTKLSIFKGVVSLMPISHCPDIDIRWTHDKGNVHIRLWSRIHMFRLDLHCNWKSRDKPAPKKHQKMGRYLRWITTHPRYSPTRQM